MTKKLDKLFGMTEETAKKLEETKDLVVVDQANVAEDILDTDQAVLDLSEVNQHELDMDKLAQTAMDGYEAIIELSQNSEPKDTSRLLEVAATMLKNAIDAKNSKVRARHKAAELLLKKKLVDNKEEMEDADVIEEEGTITGDRNRILAVIQQEALHKE